MKELCLLGLIDNNKEGDKLWSTVAYNESFSDGIKVEIFNWNFEGILLKKPDDATLGLSDNKIWQDTG